MSVKVEPYNAKSGMPNQYIVGTDETTSKKYLVNKKNVKKFAEEFNSIDINTSYTPRWGKQHSTYYLIIYLRNLQYLWLSGMCGSGSSSSPSRLLCPSVLVSKIISPPSFSTAQLQALALSCACPQLHIDNNPHFPPFVQSKGSFSSNIN